jgi:hypothetical protein
MDCGVCIFTYATALDTVTNTKQSLNRHKKSKKPEGDPVDNIDRRYRNKNGRLARKYGNTYIRTLRARYGEGFAPGERAERKLIDVLHHLDDQSLGRLIEELSGHQTR